MLAVEGLDALAPHAIATATGRAVAGAVLATLVTRDGAVYGRAAARIRACTDTGRVMLDIDARDGDGFDAAAALGVINAIGISLLTAHDRARVHLLEGRFDLTSPLLERVCGVPVLREAHVVITARVERTVVAGHAIRFDLVVTDAATRPVDPNLLFFPAP